MISCKDCGREISSSAVACPNCGAPIQSAEAKGKSALLGLVAGAAMGAVVGATTFAGRGKLGTFMFIAVTCLLAGVGFLGGKAFAHKK